jgi:hypothetical protein
MDTRNPEQWLKLHNQEKERQLANAARRRAYIERVGTHPNHTHRQGPSGLRFLAGRFTLTGAYSAAAAGRRSTAVP